MILPIVSLLWLYTSPPRLLSSRAEWSALSSGRPLEPFPGSQSFGFPVPAASEAEAVVADNHGLS